jgi:UDP-galactopyranose mutase
MIPAEYSSKINGTVITKEIPFSPTDPDEYEYPFPNSRNQIIYKKYAEKAMEESKLLVCGRLGEYRYYDMDQAIARATDMANKIIEREV